MSAKAQWAGNPERALALLTADERDLLPKREQLRMARVLANVGLVHMVYRSHGPKLLRRFWWVTAEDLFQGALSGLVWAVDHYQAIRESGEAVRFSSYATVCIHGMLHYAIDREGDRQLSKWKRVYDMQQRGVSTPFRLLPVPLPSVVPVDFSAREEDRGQYGVVGWHEPLRRAAESALREDAPDDLSALLSRAEARMLVRRMLRLAPIDSRERRILRRRFWERRTLEEVGGELGISRERARQLESRALGRIREHKPFKPLLIGAARSLGVA